MRDKRRETTRDCRGRKEHSPPDQLISRVVPRKKRVSGDPLLPDRTGGERRRFLPDLPQKLIKEKIEERIDWRGQNESQIVGKEKWQTCWCCRDQQRACRMAQASEEKLEQLVLGLPKRKEWPQCHRESNWQERRSRPCQKEKEKSRLSRVPDREGKESQGGRERHLGEKKGNQSESMERKGWAPR